MSTIQEIEEAIRNLPPQDFARLRDWLLELDHQLWDRRIEADGAAGKFDSVVKEIERNIGAISTGITPRGRRTRRRPGARSGR